MPLLRLFCDKTKCGHNTDGGCYCPVAPHHITPEMTSGIGRHGEDTAITNTEELSKCENFVFQINKK